MTVDTNNAEHIFFSSAARTATVSGSDVVNPRWRGLIVTLDVTAVTATPSITLTIEYKDPASGKYEALLVGAAVTTTGTHTYIVYPGGDVTAAEDIVEVQGVPLPYRFRITMTHADADSITYSVGGCFLL